MHGAIMAHIVAIFATLFALLNLTMANFDLYQIHGRQDGGWFHRNIDGWSLHNDDPKCEEIDLDGYWVDSGDVSHGRHGIRCEGKCEYTDVRADSYSACITYSNAYLRT